MKFDELVKKAIAMLDENDDLFCDMVEALDSYNGFGDGYRCYYMLDLDDFYYGVSASQLINDLTKDFNINDDFFYYDIEGLCSTDDRVALYRENTSSEEVFDNLRENWNNICSHLYTEFEEIMEQIINYDDDQE